MNAFKSIIKSKINIVGFRELLGISTKLRQGYICFANVHMIVEGYKNEAFQKIINNSTYTVADGVPIQKSLKLLYGVNQERIAGMDFMPSLIEVAARSNIPVFFYGSNEATLNAIVRRAKNENANLIVGGMISPPYRKLSIEGQNQINKTINDSGAKIVFVCLGCPKQEKWMAENSQKVNAVLLGVGGAFETYAGTKKRAPLWLRSIGLEWTFRLIQDPKRLFKRYLFTNSLFLFLLFKEYLKIRISRKV